VPSGFPNTRDRALTDAPFSFLGIRNFVVSLTIKLASDEMTLRKEKTYINKLNLILVQVRARFNGVRALGLKLVVIDPQTRVAS